MADRPFWSDDFDADLPLVVPGARALLGDLADLELMTHGRADRRFGNLNHPCVWNRFVGAEPRVVAFFGFRGSAKPRPCWTDAPELRCTAWEAFRDAWPHGYVMMVEQRPVWDAPKLAPYLHALVAEARGWPVPIDPAYARQVVEASIAEAVVGLREIADAAGVLRGVAGR